MAIEQHLSPSGQPIFLVSQTPPRRLQKEFEGRNDILAPVERFKGNDLGGIKQISAKALTKPIQWHRSKGVERASDSPVNHRRCPDRYAENCGHWQCDPNKEYPPDGVRPLRRRKNAFGQQTECLFVFLEPPASGSIGAKERHRRKRYRCSKKTERPEVNSDADVNCDRDKTLDDRELRNLTILD
ncbi:MAG: hypothetical protein WCA49_16995 [Candidatus Sulfotelmatobacter sp.]